MHTVCQIVVLGLEKLLFELVELAKVLLGTGRTAHALMLVNVQVVELAG